MIQQKFPKTLHTNILVYQLNFSQKRLIHNVLMILSADEILLVSIAGGFRNE
jgi:hypothetical protein